MQFSIEKSCSQQQVLLENHCNRFLRFGNSSAFSLLLWLRTQFYSRQRRRQSATSNFCVICDRFWLVKLCTKSNHICWLYRAALHEFRAKVFIETRTRRKIQICHSWIAYLQELRKRRLEQHQSETDSKGINTNVASLYCKILPSCVRRGYFLFSCFIPYRLMICMGKLYWW